jgi:hypothetical protein
MSREAHVQFCEGLARQFRWSTHIIVCFEYEEDAKGFGERLRQKLEKNLMYQCASISSMIASQIF